MSQPLSVGYAPEPSGNLPEKGVSPQPSGCCLDVCIHLCSDVTMEVGEGAEEPVTVREDQVITIQASSLLPEAAGMAAQSLRGNIYLYLLMSFFVGGSKVPCEKFLRSRKVQQGPLLESLQWEGYQVPLMIILGGCCAVAWSILFIAYDVGQEAGKVLPKISPAQEEEQEEEGGPRQVSLGERAWKTIGGDNKEGSLISGVSLKT